MRKLVLQTQCTINGFIGGVNGEMDWVTFAWTPDIIVYVTELTNSMDTILLGRKLAEGFIPHWASVAADPNNPEYEAGKIFTETPKIVFSRTLTESPWDNTTIAKADLVQEVNELKQQDGKNIIAYGGAGFVSSLIAHDLIDEYHLFINPAAISSGLSIFGALNALKHFQLADAIKFECGIAVLKYQPSR